MNHNRSRPGVPKRCGTRAAVYNDGDKAVMAPSEPDETIAIEPLAKPRVAQRPL
jgi:hypothetical protein